MSIVPLVSIETKLDDLEVTFCCDPLLNEGSLDIFVSGDLEYTLPIDLFRGFFEHQVQKVKCFLGDDNLTGESFLNALHDMANVDHQSSSGSLFAYTAGEHCFYYQSLAGLPNEVDDNQLVIVNHNTGQKAVLPSVIFAVFMMTLQRMNEHLTCCQPAG